MTRQRFRRSYLAAALALVPLWGGCGQDTTTGVESGTSCEVAPCAVFFTEVFAHAKKNDPLNEYVELFNPGGEDVDLNGCTLEIVPGSGSSRRHVVNAEAPVVVPAGGFLLLGPPSAVNVGYHWGNRLGELPNSSSKGVHVLRLRGSVDVIDEFSYMAPPGLEGLGEPTAGASFQLDPFSWTCEGNDLASNWCLGRRESGERNGSPGSANDPCVAEGQCIDGASGERRDVVSPGACDLVFGEVLNNPAGADSDKEWIEIYVAGTGPFDLNGLLLQVGDDPGKALIGADPNTCFSGAGGDRLVLVQSFDPEENGGLVVGDARFDVDLGNSNLSLRLLTPDGQVSIDEFTPPPNDPGQGVSWARIDDPPPVCPDPTPDASWFTCDYPSPGAPNTCEAPPVVAECFDAEQEETRPVVHPATCEVVISEVLNNPPGADGSQEWIELAITGPGPYDLNGLLLRIGDDTGNTPPALTFASDDCVSAAAGERLLLARSFVPAENGNLETVDATFAGTLLNNGPRVALMLPDATTVIDAVALGDDLGDGVPWTLRESQLDCEANNIEDNWCPGDPSPRELNVCPGDLPDTCSDASTGQQRLLVHPGVCDLVFAEVLNNPGGRDAGQEWIELIVTGAGPFDLDGLRLRVGNGTPAALLPLRATCTTGSAGDRFLLVQDETNPDGDARFTAGLANNDLALALLLPDGETVIDDIVLGADPGNDVSWNLREDQADCGANNDPDNWCGGTPTPKDTNVDCPAVVPDGFCLPPEGGEPRAIVSPPPDALVLSEFFANPEGTESPQEWLEFYVDAMGPYDLNGLQLRLQDHEPVPLRAETCVRVTRGDWVLLAKSADPSENGNLPTPDLLFSGTLVNSNVSLELLAPDGVTSIDAVAYAPSSAEGHSVQLDIDLLNTSDNDLEASWCRSDGAGTPGAANADCEL